jgi:hypothetical protein
MITTFSTFNLKKNLLRCRILARPALIYDIAILDPPNRRKNPTLIVRIVNLLIRALRQPKAKRSVWTDRDRSGDLRYRSSYVTSGGMLLPNPEPAKSQSLRERSSATKKVARADIAVNDRVLVDEGHCADGVLNLCFSNLAA